MRRKRSRRTKKTLLLLLLLFLFLRLLLLLERESCWWMRGRMLFLVREPSCSRRFPLQGRRPWCLYLCLFLFSFSWRFRVCGFYPGFVDAFLGQVCLFELAWLEEVGVARIRIRYAYRRKTYFHDVTLTSTSNFSRWNRTKWINSHTVK